MEAAIIGQFQFQCSVHLATRTSRAPTSGPRRPGSRSRGRRARWAARRRPGVRRARTRSPGAADRAGARRRSERRRAWNAAVYTLAMHWIMFAIGAAMSWGIYGPMMHQGQVKLGSPFRALLCVGAAYFVIGVIVPVIALMSQGQLTRSGWNVDGVVG